MYRIATKELPQNKDTLSHCELNVKADTSAQTEAETLRLRRTHLKALRTPRVNCLENNTSAFTINENTVELIR